MIPHAREAVTIFCGEQISPAPPTACWPDDARHNAELLSAAHLALSRHAPVISARANDEDDEGTGDTENLIVACPLVLNGTPFGTIAVHLNASRGQQATVLHLLQWGAAWLELAISRRAHADEPASHRCIPLVEAVLAAEGSQAAMTIAVGELARLLTCTRVSMGLVRQQKARLQALSGSSAYAQRSTLVGCIEDAMTEAYRQGQAITFSPVATDRTDPPSAHVRLSEKGTSGWIHTTVLGEPDADQGVICLERSANQPFGTEDLHFIDEVSGVIGPLIRLKQQTEGTLFRNVRTGPLGASGRRLRSSRRRLLGSILAAIALGIGALAATQGTFRVNAPAALEGRIQRVVAAPFEGYIAGTHFRPGDAVRSGETLAELDDRDLKLERRQLASQHAETLKQYNKALAELNHAQARILQAQVSQIEARLDQADSHLARTIIKAPLSGVIISGDLSQSLGAPVERGQVLFEITPLDEYRAVFSIDEADIANIAVGQQGSIALAAMPGKRIPLEVDKVVSVYKTDGEGTEFRVEAHITESSVIPKLRPGMQGIGKIEIGPRSYLWIWTHHFTNWLQLRFWSWLP